MEKCCGTRDAIVALRATLE